MSEAQEQATQQKIYVVVRWEPDEFGEGLRPEALVTTARTVEQAQTAFREYLNTYGMDWETSELEVHFGDVAHLTLDPPEESWDDEDD